LILKISAPSVLRFVRWELPDFQLQVGPAPCAFAVVVGKFQLYIQPLVLRGRKLEAPLIGAGDARSHLQRQQLPAPAGIQLREIIGLQLLHLRAHHLAGKLLLQRITLRKAASMRICATRSIVRSVRSCRPLSGGQKPERIMLVETLI
jgi:hypothetical protein